MTLLEKLNKELEKHNLVFISSKETNDKYKGILEDTKLKIQTPYEINKSLQFNMIKSHSEFCRTYMDNTIRFNKLMKGGK